MVTMEDARGKLAVQQQLMIEALAAIMVGSTSAVQTFGDARAEARRIIHQAGHGMGLGDSGLMTALRRHAETASSETPKF